MRRRFVAPGLGGGRHGYAARETTCQRTSSQSIAAGLASLAFPMPERCVAVVNPAHHRQRVCGAANCQKTSVLSAFAHDTFGFQSANTPDGLSRHSQMCSLKIGRKEWRV